MLLLRVADQIVYGRRRTLGFAHLIPVLYAGLLVWLVVGEGREISWSSEGAKLLFLYLTGLYFAQAGLFAETLRPHRDREPPAARGRRPPPRAV